jgi:hypothetical protein
LQSPDLKARIAELNKFRIPDQNIVENEYLKDPYMEWVSFPLPTDSCGEQGDQGARCRERQI